MSEIFLDTETTGLSYKDGNKIVEIACIETNDLISTNKVFHKVINPKRDMPAEAFKVHGFSNDFLSNKQTFEQIADDFLNFIKGKKLIFEEGMDRYVEQTKFANATFGTDGKVDNREEEKAMDLGTMQLTRPSKADDEATKKLFIAEKNKFAATAKPGDILRVNTKSGAVRIYIMGSANKFIER